MLHSILSYFKQSNQWKLLKFNHIPLHSIPFRKSKHCIEVPFLKLYYSTKRKKKMLHQLNIQED